MAAGLATIELTDARRSGGGRKSVTETDPGVRAALLALVATSLRVAQRDPDADDVLRGLTVRDHATLLVEYQETSAKELARVGAAGAALLHQLPLTLPARLSANARVRAGLWQNIPVANNVATADMIISSPLMGGTYVATRPTIARPSTG